MPIFNYGFDKAPITARSNIEIVFFFVIRPSKRPVFTFDHTTRMILTFYLFAKINLVTLELFMTTLKRLTIMLLVALPLAFTAVSAKAKDIVDTAISAGQFGTLVAAVQAADLVDVLKGNGPFTVFAPTDEAFSALPAGTIESLLKPENKDQLAAILTYHVVPGKIMSADIAGKNTEVATVQGSNITVNAMKGVMVDNATVVAADIEADNGVIHVIDQVVLPN